MDSICADLEFVFVYLDDILVFSKSHQEHKCHLRTLLKRLSENGLIVNKEKCQFGVSTLNFLGYTVSKDGAIPPTERVQAITNFPRPTTVKELSEFIGLITYYHRFLPKVAALLDPLYAARKGLSKNQKLSWSEDMITAFNKVKHCMATATMLVHPTDGTPLALVADASDIAVGAALQQQRNGVWEPLAFFSKRLRQSELQYSAFDKELLAL